MSSKFFTNSDGKTLLAKLEGIFKHMDIHFFDALVGFFRASGYFRIHQFLRQTGKIRILVGINIDELSWKAYVKGHEFRLNENQTVEEYLEKLKLDIQNASYNYDVEQGMLQFIKDIIDEKILLRAHPSKNLHAKIYIFRQEEEHEHASWGSVITGSSNLTEAGLEKNFEFNVELRDHDDVKYALDTFELLWNEAKPISPDSIEQVKKATYLNTDFTPFEIYIKLLIEYYGDSVNYDHDAESHLPTNYLKLRYQLDAVKDGFQKLKRYHGFFLSDVVGLGKTVIALLIAKQFYDYNGTRTRTLIVHPPALKRSWDETIHDFDLLNHDTITVGSLHKIKYPEDYDLIIVDEAHKFRSDTSDMFNQLQSICKTPRRNSGPDGTRRKKVMLISATPLNNKPEDILTLIRLFQDGRRSDLDVSNLVRFFRPHIDEYKRLKHRPLNEARESVKEISESIRKKVLQQITVRRTRKDIEDSEQYKADIDKQGVQFPKTESPTPLFYQLDDHLNDLHERTIFLLQNEVEGLQYVRYQAIRFLKPEFQELKYEKAEDISRRLAKIMKTLLVKRLDSSFHSFIISLTKYQDANRAFMKMWDNDRIHIAPKLKVEEFINDDNEELLIAKMDEKSVDDPTISTYNREAFNPDFIASIKADQQIIDNLLTGWVNWQSSKERKDPKLEVLIEGIDKYLLDPKRNPEKKLVIFSEYKDTTDYLNESLIRIGKKVLAVDSGNVINREQVIQENFDANYNIKKQKNDYEIIITTEVLAEGVNLHRSNVILNYDIPWNSTRLMQRIGRVNRIGTTADKIYIYNFYPTEQTESEIGLRKKAIIKLQAFHTALGEDSQIYSTEEEFDSFGLFDQPVEEGENEELRYLMFLRRFKDQHPDWFKRIKKMPKRSRTGRMITEHRGSSLIFLRNYRRNGFYRVNNNLVEEISFIEAIPIFEALTDEKGHPLPKYNYTHVQLACKKFAEDTLEDSQSTSKQHLSLNDKKALNFLGRVSIWDLTSKEENEIIKEAMQAIDANVVQSLPKEIVRFQKTVEKSTPKLKPAVIIDKLMDILDRYSFHKAEETEEPQYQKIIPDIIISESFL